MDDVEAVKIAGLIFFQATNQYYSRRGHSGLTYLVADSPNPLPHQLVCSTVQLFSSQSAGFKHLEAGLARVEPLDRILHMISLRPPKSKEGNTTAYVGFSTVRLITTTATKAAVE